MDMKDLHHSVQRVMALHGMATSGEPLWVAVSGGIDSMVLLHVLRALGHPCAVAHVDHGLRGAASDADRAFVEEHCRQLGIPCRVHRCDVAAAREASGSSVQMAARDLRYAWFRDLLREGPHAMALAHHADDALETFLMGLLQGMGLAGWRGIPAVTQVAAGGEGTLERSAPLVASAQRFIRPLLGVGRSAVEEYARAMGIPFREDASNADTAYLRNRIRHQLLPFMQEMRPGARRVLARNIAMLERLTDHAEAHVRQELDGLVQQVGEGVTRVHLAPLRAAGPSARLLLHALLSGHGFHPDQLDDLLIAIRRGATGARFEGPAVDAWLGHDELRIVPRTHAPAEWTIQAVDVVPAGAPLRLHAEDVAAVGPAFVPDVAWFDADALEFPLLVRPWRAGDRLRPLGMAGSKLVSDVLTDAKIAGHAKRGIHVLESAGRIVWVCGVRLAEGVQARAGSRAVVRAEWLRPVS